jgi:hypothetical protein
MEVLQKNLLETGYEISRFLKHGDTCLQNYILTRSFHKITRKIKMTEMIMLRTNYLISMRNTCIYSISQDYSADLKEEKNIAHSCKNV